MDQVGGLWVLTGQVDPASAAVVWSGSAAAVPMRTEAAPALCVFQGQLVCAAVQSGGGGVSVTTSPDGGTWSAPVATPYQSGLCPGLCPGPLGDSLELLFADPVTRHVWMRPAVGRMGSIKRRGQGTE